MIFRTLSRHQLKGPVHSTVSSVQKHVHYIYTTWHTAQRKFRHCTPGAKPKAPYSATAYNWIAGPKMPLYDVEHVTPLTPAQQESLAVALTDLHSARFHTPRAFLNVRYTDAHAQVVFRGGRRAVYNRVVLRTRAGEQRTKELYDEHCRDIVRAWESVVGEGADKGLRTVWVLAALTTALECGIARPRVSYESPLLVVSAVLCFLSLSCPLIPLLTFS